MSKPCVGALFRVHRGNASGMQDPRVAAGDVIETGTHSYRQAAIGARAEQQPAAVAAGC